MQTKKVKSVWPIYIAGIGILLYAILFPYYLMQHYLIGAAIGIIFYFVGNKIFPGKEIKTYDPLHFDKSGSKEADVLISKGKRFIDELRELDKRISDETISNNIHTLETVSKDIFLFISKNPANARQLQTYMDYYFPTLLKLLNTYVDMDEKNTKSTVIIDTQNKIKHVMAQFIPAFRNQLDKLYQDQALDVQTDITVLKNILAQENVLEGGSGNGPF